VLKTKAVGPAASRLLLGAWISTLAAVAGLAQHGWPGQPSLVSLVGDVSWTKAEAWLSKQGPLGVALACWRLGALAIAAWFLVAILASVAARLLEARGLASSLDRLNLSWVRRTLGKAFSEGALSISLASGSLAPTPTPPSRPPLLQAVPEAPTPLLWGLAKEHLRQARPVTAEPPHDARLHAATEVHQDARWVVRTGESFWSIAAELLAKRGQEPTDREIASFCEALIRINQGRLRSPADPSLIYPGQVFLIPPKDEWPR
jgi:hypothetical protein